MTDERHTHDAECGCGLPRHIAFALNSDMGGNWTMGRNIPRALMIEALQDIVTQLQVMEAAEQAVKNAENGDASEGA